MTLMPAKVEDVVLGIDLGGTKTLIGVIDKTYSIHHRIELPTSSINRGDISALVGGLDDAVQRAEANSMQVVAAGLGIAGVPDSGGEDVSHAPNLGMLPGSRIGQSLFHELSVPVLMENDVNLAALGEQLCGVAQEASHFVFISMGTGLGVALIDEGRVIRGYSGGAGEVGSIRSHMMDTAKQRFLTFEEALSGPNFSRRAEKVLGGAMAPSTIIDLADWGSPEAEQMIEDYLDALADLIVILRSLADPEIIVLGGGLGSNGGILRRLKAALAKKGVEAPVERSSLGQDAALIGARGLWERRGFREQVVA